MDPFDLPLDLLNGCIVWRAVWLALGATRIAAVWMLGLSMAIELGRD